MTADMLDFGNRDDEDDELYIDDSPHEVASSTVPSSSLSKLSQGATSGCLQPHSMRTSCSSDRSPYRLSQAAFPSQTRSAPILGEQRLLESNAI